MILFDTGPLVALCDARDAHHTRSLTDLEAFSGDSFAVCEAVLVEACFHLPHRAQRLRLHALLDRLEVAQLPATLEGSYRDEVFRWLLKYADHEPDWADGCLAVLCGLESDIKVWSYDREFRTTWRLLNGRPIPLA